MAHASPAPSKSPSPKPVAKATWSAAQINDLPDGSFAFIEAGGKKVDGKTEPRSLRHLPYKDADGKIDVAHTRAALQRLDQTKEIPESRRASIRSKLETALANAQKQTKGRDARKAVKKVDGLSFDQLEDLLCEALEAKYPPQDPEEPWKGCPRVCDVYDSTVVFSIDGKLYELTYTIAAGEVSLNGEAVEVMRTYAPVGQAAPAAPAAPATPPAEPAKAVDATKSFDAAITKGNAFLASLGKKKVLSGKEVARVMLADAVAHREGRPPHDLAKDGDGGAGNMTGADLEQGGELPPAVAQNPNPKHRRYRGIDVVIDRPIGFVQTGKAEDGTAWSRTYKNDYGYIEGTLGGDGEALDVFFGDDEDAPEAQFAVQQRADGTFDEYKLFLGAGSKEKAEQIYKDHIPAKFLKSMATTSVEFVKALLGQEPVEVMKRLLVAELGKALAAADRDEERPFIEFLETVPVVRQIKRSGEPEFYSHFVTKADASATEQRYVLGPVLVPEKTDAQGDIYSAAVIEATAWRWAASFRNIGLMHKGLVNDRIQFVESYIARVDQIIGGATIKAGTWMLGAIVKDDELWQAVKEGRLTGWSIGGRAAKQPA